MDRIEVRYTDGQSERFVVSRVKIQESGWVVLYETRPVPNPHDSSNLASAEFEMGWLNPESVQSIVEVEHAVEVETTERDANG